MCYTGIVSYSGMTVGRGSGANATAVMLAPVQMAAHVGDVEGESRRHVQNTPAEIGRRPRGVERHLQVIDGPAPRIRAEPSQGTVLTFLVQHIAQEVTPEAAGFDRHAKAAQAYIGARDFNAEMLPQGAGLDLTI